MLFIVIIGDLITGFCMGDNNQYNGDIGCDAELRDVAAAPYDVGLCEDYAPLDNEVTTSKFLLSRAQKIIISTCLIYMALQFYYAPQVMVILLCALMNSVYIILIWVRMRLLMTGQERSDAMNSMECTLPDEALPSYSIIVPLYQEEKSLQQVIHHIKQLDYPSNLLTVFMVLEGDDLETINAMKLMVLPENFVVIYVPPSSPRTKPKACNYAMEFVKSELVVIFDAEDIPSPMQLRNVAQQFYEGDKSLGCVQCQLGFYNGGENWLCSMFSLEYRVLFNYLLPALDVLGLPIPLGGTSNHLRVDMLKKIGQWDPYNVTEDAELGLRLVRNGFKTKVIYSRTHEEAPNNLFVWLRQRTRWIKGYLQTYMAHTRQPDKFVKDVGLKAAAWCSCFIGLSSIAHILPVIGAFIFIFPFTRSIVPQVWVNISSIVMCVGMASIFYSGYLARKSLYRTNHFSVKLWWSYPFYFILHTIASLRAVYQLITALHLWEKTPHNISAPSLE